MALRHKKQHWPSYGGRQDLFSIECGICGCVPQFMRQTANDSRARVVLADDDAMFAEALREFLSAEYEVVGIVGTGSALVQAAAELQPNVAVVDIDLELPNGRSAICELKARRPSIKLVCVTKQSKPALLVESFRIGISALLAKNSPATELLTAIQGALIDRLYISPLIAKEVVDDLLKAGMRREYKPQLTSRQREVLRQLAEGKSMKSIAVTLGISVRTVQFHKYEMMKNLNVKTNAAIVQYAMQHGIVRLS
jgi:DNA-binding NarL/FixJ family response regulator